MLVIHHKCSNKTCVSVCLFVLDQKEEDEKKLFPKLVKQSLYTWFLHPKLKKKKPYLPALRSAGDQKLKVSWKHLIYDTIFGVLCSRYCWIVFFFFHFISGERSISIGSFVHISLVSSSTSFYWFSLLSGHIKSNNTIE